LIFPFLLSLIVVVLCIANYELGTYLSGWDTLHPEFNFSSAFKRMLSGVWRSDQGLGAVAIQSHMADLPRVIYLWLTSFILPTSFLRYSYFFLMLLAGPLGIYFLVFYLTGSGQKSGLAGFLAALTYLLNLGTLQHFVVPLEMFATQYGLLPWLFWLIFRILKGAKKKWLIAFSIVSFLASPQAHTATLFYAYFLALVIFLGTFFLLHRQQGRILLGRLLVILLITLSVNIYWMLPNIYAVKTQALEMQESKVNQLFTPEALAKNQTFGKLKHAVILRSFLFDWQVYNTEKRNFETMLVVWQKHFEDPIIFGIGYGVFGLSLFGMVIAVRKKRRKVLAFMPVYLLALVMLLNGTWPVSVVFERLGVISPILQEALRFPFTKFSILFMAMMSFYVGCGLSRIFYFVKGNYPSYGLALLYGGLLITYFLPAFRGNLIHPTMRINIPEEYDQMFNWFKNQDQTGRVAILPIHSFWNWAYYDWGYQGAGFLQFGIPQPILDRDYNRWNRFNEQHQREMAYAIYSQDPAKIRMALRKFNIRWVLFDDSVIAPGISKGATLKWLIPDLLEKTGITMDAAQFGENIRIYSVKPDINNQIMVYQDLLSIGPEMIGALEDVAYASVGPYFTKQEENDIYDPFRASFTRAERFVSDFDGKLVASASAESRLSPVAVCGTGEQIGGREAVGKNLTYISKSRSLCDHFSFPELTHNKSYLVEITSKNIEGFPLQICVSNDLTQHCDLFVHLHTKSDFKTERLLLPPLFDYGKGYTVNINNFTIKDRQSTNELSEVKVYEVDYGVLSRSSFLSSLDLSERVWRENIFPKKWGTWFYEVGIRDQGLDYKGAGKNDSLTLVLSQAHHSGWKAFYLDGFRPIFLNHVLVNNWANGWQLSGNGRTIYIIFWPQLLEFLGFGILGATLLWLVFWKKK